MPDARSISHGGEGPRLRYERLQEQDRKHTNYFRMFPDLDPLTVPTSILGKIGAKEGPMVDKDEEDEKNNPWTPESKPDPDRDNVSIPAGYTYLGQFIDHDLTLDFTSDHNRRNNPRDLINARTPAFDLDSIYGLGPETHPHLYDGEKLVTREGGKDLQRRADSTDELGKAVAIIGDPRNDENQLVAQVHLAFINLHNWLVDQGYDFETARRFTRWHYQWIVLRDFLPRLVGQDLVDDIRYAGPAFFPEAKRNSIPVEFTVAAYRFGHSQVRPSYAINVDSRTLPVFRSDKASLAEEDLRGSTRLDDDKKVEWSRFFDIKGSNPQPTRLIDTRLSEALFRMFPGPVKDGTSESEVPHEERLLAFRNLRRGVALGLPSGESVAEYVKSKLSDKGRPHGDINPELGDENLGDVYRELRGEGETPLWYWILAEAKATRGGKKLGPVGGRIVAEVFIGLLWNDDRSFIRQEPNWKPLEEFRDSNQRMDMANLLNGLEERA